MMRNNAGLMPTSIVDRNGRATTVYKKVQSAISNRIPARLMPSKKNVDKTTLLEQAIGDIKCDSPKHHWLACREQDCPEGKSVEWFKRQYEQDTDIRKQIADDGIINPDLDGASLRSDRGYNLWVVNDKAEDRMTEVRLPPYRPEVLDAAAAIDKSAVPSFETHKELCAFVKDLYGMQNIYVEIMDKSVYGAPNPVQHYSLSELHVSADLRGLGIGKHVMDMVEKFADEHGAVFTTVPSEAGDGALAMNYLRPNDDSPYNRARVEHYKRLRGFYARHGFVNNEGYDGDGVDLLTGTYFKINNEFVKSLTPESAESIRYGLMIRYPNGEIPEKMLRDES